MLLTILSLCCGGKADVARRPRDGSYAGSAGTASSPNGCCEQAGADAVAGAASEAMGGATGAGGGSASTAIPAGAAGASGGAPTSCIPCAGSNSGADDCVYVASQPQAVPREFLARDVTWDNDDRVLVRVVGRDDGAYHSRKWYELWFERMDRGGAVVTNERIYTTYQQESPSGLAVNVGTAMLLAMIRTDSGFAALWNENDQKRLLFALLDADGKLRSEPALLSREALNASLQPVPARLLWNGTEYAALWGSNSHVGFASLDRNGSILSQTTVAEPRAFVEDAYLFSDEDGYVAFFQELLPAVDDASFVRLDPLGNPVAAPRLLTGPEDRYTDVVWAGKAESTYLALLSVYSRALNGSAVVLREYDRDGTTVGAELPVAASNIFTLDFNGRHFGLLLNENDITNFAQLGRDGSVGSQRIEIARSLVQRSGTTTPFLGRFEWHNDAFTLYYAPPENSTGNAYYVELRCAE